MEGEQGMGQRRGREGTEEGQRRDREGTEKGQRRDREGTEVAEKGRWMENSICESVFAHTEMEKTNRNYQ